MKPISFRWALGILGALLVAVAVVRLAISLVQSLHVSEPASPTGGFIIGISVDFFTLGLIAAGGLLCVLGFRARSSGV